MTRVVLFGVSSPLIVDYEETCRRLGWEICLGVKNVAAPAMCSDKVIVKTIDSLHGSDRANPFLVPLFTPKHRQFAAQQAIELGFTEAPAMIDKTAVVAGTTALAQGCYVNSGSVIASECRIGRHVVVSRACSIGHHAQIGEFVSFGPGSVICGLVTIGNGSVVGAGAVILPQITIGSNSIIGAGAIVTKNIADNLKVVSANQLTIQPTSGYSGSHN